MRTAMISGALSAATFSLASALPQFSAYEPAPRITLVGSSTTGFATGISRCVPIGDIDGDGGIDLAAAGIHQSAVHRGIDGKRLHLDSVSGVSLDYGRALSRAGDVDNDGYEDYVVGDASHSSSGRVFVRSGLTGAILTTFTESQPGAAFGIQIASVGDVDLDGSMDLAIGAAGKSLTPSNLAEGAAYVYSANGGAPLLAWVGNEQDDHFGATVSGAGDVDQDGVPDVLVGGPSAGPGSAGEMLLCSGATGGVLLTHSDPAVGDSFGNAATSVGDFDGDGLPDRAIGAASTTIGAATKAGRVFLYSGASVAPFLVLSGASSNESLGHALGAGGDLDGDGRDDLVVVSRKKHAAAGGIGRVSAYGSSTHGVVHFSQAVFTSFTYVDGPTILGDLDQDGVPEYAAGDMTGSPNGIITVTPVCAGSAARKGDGCLGLGGFEPRLRFAGCPAPGGLVTLRVEEARGSALGIILFGTAYNWSDIPDPIGFNCTRYVNVLLPLQIPFTTTAGGAGQGTLTISGNLVATPLPATVAMQAFIVDLAAPSGFSATNGLYLDN